MKQINAVITGVGGYVPDYILTNDEISRIVDTTDEWIMGRIGIKERRILNEEGLGTSYMARKLTTSRIASKIPGANIQKRKIYSISCNLNALNFLVRLG